jgi:DNA-binding CsgD family transcriptional regulator
MELTPKAAFACGSMVFCVNIRSATPPQAFPELTDREREVLDLIAQGNKDADIAARLVLSSKTVRNHVTNILSKLQVADRAEAIVRAREAGLVAPRKCYNVVETSSITRFMRCRTQTPLSRRQHGTCCFICVSFFWGWGGHKKKKK